MSRVTGMSGDLQWKEITAASTLNNGNAASDANTANSSITDNNAEASYSAKNAKLTTMNSRIPYKWNREPRNFQHGRCVHQHRAAHNTFFSRSVCH